MKNSGSKVIDSFNKGLFFKKNDLLSTEDYAIQIILYHDDFGISNPLGNKVKKYKTSAFYFVLGNIPTRFRSRLKDNSVGFVVSISTHRKVWVSKIT